MRRQPEKIQACRDSNEDIFLSVSIHLFTWVTSFLGILYFFRLPLNFTKFLYKTVLFYWKLSKTFMCVLFYGGQLAQGLETINPWKLPRSNLG